jgi:hypothetical protein
MKLKYLLIIVIIYFFIQNPFICNWYSSELQNAYTWAFNNWITTQSTIDKANMDWEITRIELSKMISNYAINVLKKDIDSSKKCDFSDVTVSLNKQYDNWVMKACQLWLMWQWITKFRPYNKVTRSEFWTILSRALYWDKYNWWNPYYEKHLNQLNSVWIIKSISNAESRKEIRWYIMLMMMRSRWVKQKSLTVILDKLKRDYIWNIIYSDNLIKNWEKKVYSIFSEITGDNTLYFSDKYWFAFTLWKDWKWWEIESSYETALTSIWIRKNNLNVYGFYIYDNNICFDVNCVWEDQELLWKNNKYTFVKTNFDKNKTEWEVVFYTSK